MVFAALVVSAPFAWMHSAQVAKAWGPLVLLYCVSLALMRGAAGGAVAGGEYAGAFGV
jgi:hypothetical protein